eukprot:2369374-Prymnesium_polylepis.1
MHEDLLAFARSTPRAIPLLSLRSVLERAPADRRGECARVLATTCIAPASRNLAGKGCTGSSLLRAFVHDTRGARGAQLRCAPEAYAAVPALLEAALTRPSIDASELPAFEFDCSTPPATHASGAEIEPNLNSREFVECTSRADADLAQARTPPAASTRPQRRTPSLSRRAQLSRGGERTHIGAHSALRTHARVRTHIVRHRLSESQVRDISARFIAALEAALARQQVGVAYEQGGRLACDIAFEPDAAPRALRKHVERLQQSDAAFLTACPLTSIE